MLYKFKCVKKRKRLGGPCHDLLCMIVFDLHFISLGTSRILFEMETLASCSPSLLSRVSWLYFQEDQIADWSCIYYSWTKTMHSKYAMPMHQ